MINFLLQEKAELLKILDKARPMCKWKHQILPHGNVRLRTWLAYSMKKQAIFCLHCLIFGSPHATRNVKAFAMEGYAEWHNVSRDVEIHEATQYHKDSEMSLIRWNANQSRIDKNMADSQNKLVQHHRAVVSVIIDCLRYLSQEMMALRNSHAEKGKLINLFRLLAKYNGDARLYLETWEKHREDKKRLRINFLANDSIINLVNIMKDLVLKKICKRIGEAVYFSIISDSTQDTSKAESTVVLTRYIEVRNEGTASASLTPCPVPVERLIGVFTSKGTSGQELFEKIMDVLKKNKLNFLKIIGQSYDGAGNMSGLRKGLRTCFQNVCPMALYIWCHSHKFSLVVEDTIKTIKEIELFLSLIEEIHTCMNGHRRHGTLVEVLKEAEKKEGKIYLSKRRLKRVLTTHWSSKKDACTTLLVCFPEVIKCLEILEKDENSSKETITKAVGLKTRFLSVDFVATLKICVVIFNTLSPATTCLQGTVMIMDLRLISLTTPIDSWKN